MPRTRVRAALLVVESIALLLGAWATASADSLGVDGIFVKQAVADTMTPEQL